MLKTNAKTKGISFLSLIAVLFLTVALAFTSACTDNDASSSDSSTGSSSATVTDEHTLLNGNFEYYAERDDITFPYKTSIRWTNTRGYIVSTEDYAPSSDATSGIIDTSDEKYQKLLDESKVGDVTLSEYLKDGEETFNPHSPSYYGYTEKDPAIPDKSENGGQRVLMIHNRVRNAPGEGTSQYFYTSGSTLSLAAGQRAILTVWVNTFGLKTDMLNEDAEYGAYVRVVDRLNSTTASPLIVKNIDTKGNWGKVTIYIEGNAFASSSYTLYLGLGMGSKHVAQEFVEGFAFFDDVTFEVLNENDDDYEEKLAGFDEKVAAVSENNTHRPLVKNDAGALSLTEEKNAYEIDMCKLVPTFTANNKDDKDSYSAADFYLTFDPEGDAYPVSVSSDNVKFNESAFLHPDLHNNPEAMKENIGVKTAAELATLLGDEKAFYDDADADEAFFKDDDEFIYFNYTTSSSFTVVTDSFTLPADGRILISFWAKVKLDNTPKASGLSLSIRDHGLSGKEVEKDDYDVTSIFSGVTGTEDKNGWTKYTVLIENTKKTINATTGYEDDDSAIRVYDFVLVFGPDEESHSNNFQDFPKGYALVGGFGAVTLTEDSASLFSAGTSVSLGADVGNYNTEENDSYTFTAREAQIENGQLTQPLSIVQPYNITAENSGVFNTQYTKSLKDSAGHTYDDLSVIEKQDEDGKNEYVQALAIGDAAGYYTTRTTVSANTTASVSVRLTTLGNAEAYINIINRDKFDEVEGYAILTLASADVKTENYIGDRTALKDVAFTHKFTAAKEGEWETVTFYVRAGNEPIEIGVEVFNGERFSSEPVTGVVIIDSIAVSAASTETYESLSDAAELEGITPVTDIKFGYRTDSYNVDNHEEHITTEVNGVEEYVYTYTEDVGLCLEYTDTEKKEYVLYASFLATNYEDKIYVEAPTDSGASSDSASDSSSESSSDAEAAPSQVQWLEISSIVIAAALIVALAAVIIRFFVKKYRAKKVKATAYYDADARDRTSERIRANKAKREAAEKEAEDETYEDDAYDYDAASNIDESQPAEAAEPQQTEAEAEQAEAEQVEAEPAEPQAESEQPAEPEPQSEGEPEGPETPAEQTEAPAGEDEDKKDE